MHFWMYYSSSLEHWSDHFSHSQIDLRPFNYTGIYSKSCYGKAEILLKVTIPLGSQAQFQMSKPSYLDVPVQILSQTLACFCDWISHDNSGSHKVITQQNLKLTWCLNEMSNFVWFHFTQTSGQNPGGVHNRVRTRKFMLILKHYS